LEAPEVRPVLGAASLLDFPAAAPAEAALRRAVQKIQARAAAGAAAQRELASALAACALAAVAEAEAE